MPFETPEEAHGDYQNKCKSIFNQMTSTPEGVLSRLFFFCFRILGNLRNFLFFKDETSRVQICHLGKYRQFICIYGRKPRWEEIVIVIFRQVSNQSLLIIEQPPEHLATSALQANLIRF